ncbi:unnamed protein product [Moneuplotes crassus]|uniref:Uncharacterized protein n=1 Tax=Euplotes crassus TaxID=5936 RepID=A0AAD1Y9Y2_EUPCR|nr:unnamed protein product [Moneuplotes crassus]
MNHDNVLKFVRKALEDSICLPKINSLSIQNCDNLPMEISYFLQNVIKQNIPCLYLSGLQNLLEIAYIDSAEILKIIPYVTKELSLISFLFISKNLSNLIGKASLVETLSLLDCEWSDYYLYEQGRYLKFELEKEEYKIKNLKLSLRCGYYSSNKNEHVWSQYETMILAISLSSLKKSLEHLHIIDESHISEDELKSFLSSIGLDQITPKIG